ncbi:hypothetical protein [Mucilaginibacter sp. UYCu711]|uniref:hypothetical protein n=1 Tax=Mucilaginibacter sp. UYCu711 TaxID=3156339 RepID=UPI003D1C2723
MQFDPENPINKLCANGMLLEGEGKQEEAAKLFYQAWDEASNSIEKFTAAHYVARHQGTIAAKLEWDIIAVKFAIQDNSQDVKAILPSLYLNIAKGYEDLNKFAEARENYQLALGYTIYLPKDGYGSMITAGISKGIERVTGS